jgi:TolB-like protein/Tfp pilus assembly protein PilF
MASIRLKLLGSFEARRPSGPILEIAGKKNQALLAYIALRPGKYLPREKLADLLWSDRGEAQARNSLRQALVTLRRDLRGIEPAPLLFERDTIAGDAAAISTDVAEFERLAASGTLDDLRQAAKLYEGDFLDGFVIRDPAFEEWLSTEQNRLREAAITVLDRLAALASGAEAVTVARRLLALDVLREASHRTLMQIHAAQGQRDQATRQYHACRDILRRELGVEPSKPTVDLHREISENRYQPAPRNESPAPYSAPLPLATHQATPADKPSIAVLPFLNMSGDEEQEYFSDGITEDIITDLSRVSGLFVIARNTAFTFKGKAVEVVQAARNLNVRYVLEGSIRKVGSRVRINTQLIDGTTGGHVWADRYDRALGDIFALQDEISQATVAALKVRLLPQERKAIERRSTQNPEAYELYLQARHYLQQRGARNLETALRFCHQALEIDPGYSRAWASVALCQALLYVRGRSEDAGLAAAEKAISLDPTLAEAYAAKGRALAELGHEEEAVAAHETSLRLDPESSDVQYYFGRTCHQFGRHEAAIRHLERAAQLLETDYFPLALASQSYELLGRKGEATRTVRRALELIEREIGERPDNVHAIVQGAWALAYLGEEERASEWARRAAAIDPDDPLDHYNLACALTRMNKAEQALDLLEACASKLSPEWINWVKQDSDLLPLRDHPRYKALVGRGESRLAATRKNKAIGAASATPTSVVQPDLRNDAR